MQRFVRYLSCVFLCPASYLWYILLGKKKFKVCFKVEGYIGNTYRRGLKIILLLPYENNIKCASRVL